MKKLFKIIFVCVVLLCASTSYSQEFPKYKVGKGEATQKETAVKQRDTKKAKAAASVKQIEDVKPEVVPVANEADDEFIRLMKAGAGHVSKKQYLDALEKYNRAMTFNRETPRVLRCRAAAYAGNKDYLSAIKDYDEAIRLNTDYAGEVYYSRGLSKTKLAEPDRAGACTDFKKAKELGFDIDTDELIEEYCL